MSYQTRNTSRNFNSRTRNARRFDNKGYEQPPVKKAAIEELDTAGKRKARLLCRIIEAGATIAEKRKLFRSKVSALENAWTEKHGIFPSSSELVTEEVLNEQVTYNEEKLAFITSGLLEAQ